MWVHKTTKEIADQRRKLWFAFGGPFFILILVFFCGVIKDMAGLYKAGHSPSREFTLGQILSFASGFAVSAAIVTYLCQLLFGRPLLSLMEKSKVLICDKCFRMKNSDGQQSCECGGKFEDFDLWKWIDD
jgi:hypothetical protein